MNRNLKLVLATIYLICLLILIFGVFYFVDLSDLRNFSFIKENSNALISFKDKNLIVFSFIFFLFSALWVLFLGFGSPIAIASGFIFGKWLGTIITVSSFTVGSSILYLLANLYFKEFIKKYLSSRIARYKILFSKNELLYFMIFRFAGGGGIPFAIQNVLPVIFNMKMKNYFYSTFIGLIPMIFVINALGSGIENIIDQSDSIKLTSIIYNKEIYLPLISFLVVLILSYLVKLKFFKK